MNNQENNNIFETEVTEDRDITITIEEVEEELTDAELEDVAGGAKTKKKEVKIIHVGDVECDLRANAGEEYPLLKTLKPHTKLTYLAYDKVDRHGRKWAKVDYRSTVGFIRKCYIA